MDLPFEFSLRDVHRTERLDALIARRVAKLERMFTHVVGCRLDVERVPYGSEHNSAYRVRVEVWVPNGTLVSTRDTRGARWNEDVTTAVREAFDKAQRQLADYKHRLHGVVKASAGPPVALISRVYPEDGYGFLRTEDGRELYFHENALLDATLRQVHVGDEARFAESDDESGPHVSTLHVRRALRS
jgi:ribosomal subunit interface protein